MKFAMFWNACYFLLGAAYYLATSHGIALATNARAELKWRKWLAWSVSLAVLSVLVAIWAATGLSRTQASLVTFGLAAGAVATLLTGIGRRGIHVRTGVALAALAFLTLTAPVR